MKKWPKYTLHEDASCFNCGGDFGDRGWPMKSGFAPGSGYWFQICNKCGMESFYDLKSGNEIVAESFSKVDVWSDDDE